MVNRLPVFATRGGEGADNWPPEPRNRRETLTDSAKLQAALEAARPEWGEDLQELVDFHIQSDHHDHDHEYVVAGVKSLLAEAAGAEVFEATLPAEHYEYATVTFYVYGKDEDDAVRRLQAALDAES